MIAGVSHPLDGPAVWLCGQCTEHLPQTEQARVLLMSVGSERKPRSVQTHTSRALTNPQQKQIRRV
jgi:hypothetical protein